MYLKGHISKHSPSGWHICFCPEHSIQYHLKSFQFLGSYRNTVNNTINKLAHKKTTKKPTFAMPYQTIPRMQDTPLLLLSCQYKHSPIPQTNPARTHNHITARSSTLEKRKTKKKRRSAHRYTQDSRACTYISTQPFRSKQSRERKIRPTGPPGQNISARRAQCLRSRARCV